MIMMVVVVVLYVYCIYILYIYLSCDMNDDEDENDGITQFQTVPEVEHVVGYNTTRAKKTSKE